MNERAREILDEARETRDRLADFKVTRRVHRDDGHSSDWAAGMPPKPPPVTVEDVRQIVRDALAAQPRAVTAADVETVVERVLRDNSVVTAKAIAPVLHELRQQLRKEMRAAKVDARQGEEFFYHDDSGRRQDAALHARIINPVDYPIDEKIMGPIRDRNRARWLADQRTARGQRRA